MGCTQISINGIVTIPKHKPDIQSILRISTTATIDNTITVHKKIFFAGHVDVCIEYVACSTGNLQPIHFLQSQLPFNGLLFHPLARKRFRTWLKTKIRFCEAEITSSRTIDTIVLVKLCKLKFSRIAKHAPHPCCPPATQAHAGACHCGHTACCEEPAPTADVKHHQGCQPAIQCAPPASLPDCKPAACSCLPSAPVEPCQVQHNCQCKPDHPGVCPPAPVEQLPGCQPVYVDMYNPSGCQHKYKSYHSGYCKPQARSPAFPEGYHIPTAIQPYTRLGNSHGVAFGSKPED